ncbi:hypothetical protein J8273_8191 [Carpediemonas membranifera]|uniref:CCHC-type domain-containing protein n=1 Tax=Carpediemonas membranifera TaxID=201153 RepID=A0A8J6APN2_9EUKA|nr:hypothetical protein J8273_8191 [Carpediemonas membranifera]|eukprot:KAG9390151.1 hypothetical protein J8273_8191 [Carpediemonas membranifera]
MTFKNKEKAVPPLFRDPSMKALLDFYLHLQTYRSLGGKADISELVDPSIADYVSQCIDEAGNSEDDDYVPLLMATTERRRQKRNFSDLRILKRLGSVLRPSRSTAQLDLFRLRAKTFDPVEVNNVNRKFKALQLLVNPDVPEDVLKETYCRCFRVQGSNTIMYKVKELAEGLDIPSIMPKVMAMSRDLQESQEMVNSFSPAAARPRAPHVHEREPRSDHQDPSERHDRQGSKPIVKPNRQNKPKKQYVCYNCGKPGHPSFKCAEPKAFCPKCHKSGHLADYCPTKKGSKSASVCSFCFGFKIRRGPECPEGDFPG